MKYPPGKELDLLIDKEYPSGLDPIPNYSTNDVEAFKVYMKLRNAGQFCCITIGTDYEYCWQITIFPGYGLDPTDSHVAILKYDGVESYAHMICNAVLEACRYAKLVKFSNKVKDLANESDNEEI